MDLSIESSSLTRATCDGGRAVRPIADATGYTTIQALYLELLFSCNFRCRHCYHGENLERAESLSRSDVASLMKHFNENYNTRAATFLGGEPFLHPDILPILHDAKALGMSVAVCTNGFRISRKLENCPGLIDDLRVSIDGLAKAHDSIRRRPGSFDACVETLRRANALRIPTSVTCTVTANNADDLYGLTHLLADLGVRYLKLHRLRNIGFASTDPSLEPSNVQLNLIPELVRGLRRTVGIELIVDGDLLGDTFETTVNKHPPAIPTSLNHIELNPAGDIYLSCKAVGDSRKAAFHYDLATRSVSYDPTATDELTLATPHVVYYQIGAAACS